MKRIAGMIVLLAGLASAQTTPNIGLNQQVVGRPGFGPGIIANWTILDGYLGGSTQLPRSFWTNANIMAYRGAWLVGTPYNVNDLVMSGSASYISLVAGNLGNAPASSPAQWVVVGSGGGGGGGVSQIVAGANVTISPSNGLGAVTINAIAGGGGGGPLTVPAIIVNTANPSTGPNIDPFDFNSKCNGFGVNAGNPGGSLQGWGGCRGFVMNQTSSQPGITQLMTAVVDNNHPGDSEGIGYFYQTAWGGATDASGEGSGSLVSTLTQRPWVYGSINSGATTGSLQIGAGSLAAIGFTQTPAFTGYTFTAEQSLLDTKTPTAAITLTSCFPSSAGAGCTGSGGGPDNIGGLYYTFTGGSLTSSTAWGDLLSSSCVGAGVWSASTTYATTQWVTFGGQAWTSIQSGNVNNRPDISPAFWSPLGQFKTLASFTCNVNLGTGSGNFTASSLIHLAATFHEDATVTAVGVPSAGVQSITFNTYFAWDNGYNATVMQGTPTQAFVVANTLHNPIQSTDWPVAYQILGVVANRMYISNCVSGQCTGVASSNIPAMSRITITGASAATLARSGNLVTVTGLNPSQFSTPTQNIFAFPVGSQVIVTGAGDASFNGTFTITANSSNVFSPSFSWAQTGANSTTATYNLATGNTIATVFPSAMTTGNLTATTGAATLEPNTVAWTNGDQVVGAPSSEVNFTGMRVTSGIWTANDGAQASKVADFTDIGPSPEHHIVGIFNNSLGGIGIYDTAALKTQWFIQNRPYNNGNVIFNQGTDLGPANNPYGIYHDGLAGIEIYPATNTVGIDGNLQAPTFRTNLYTVGTLPSAAGVGAGIQVTVSDATTFTPGTCTGGGADYMIAISNGTTWSCH